MDQRIIMCQGLPASGKSTWSKQYCIDHPEFIRINKDDIRESFYPIPYSPEFEERIIDLERLHADIILSQGKSLIIDDTNFKEKYVNYWKNFANIRGIQIEIKRFDISMEECIKRDASREKSVGKDEIIGMYEKYRETYNLKDI